MRRNAGLFHPSRARLREWLDTGGPAGVGDHVERCDRCADRLEQIDQSDPLPLSLDGPGALQAGLRELIRLPDDLVDRVLTGIDSRRRAERELALLAGLFSIGVETAQLMVAPVPDLESDHHERTHDERHIVDDQEEHNS